ncbi:MAG: hypothetical protein M3069_19375 [Chloroflexota bacterium]|nr:hypothetical protein [Chloroflexota bacterium]
MTQEAAREPSRTGARQRRRGLYGPPARLTRTSPLTGRLVWHIGDWGRASEHIGARWEHVAGSLAREQLGPGDYLIVLAATPSLMAEVLGSGLPHADALRTWREDGRLALEPLDFKWSLETASERQVSTETLEHLLAAELPSLDSALAGAREAVGLEPSAPVEARAGRFVAPLHPANHAALVAEPELPTLLLPVEPRAFFEPLPGWATARTLARLESSDLDRLSGIQAIERYYRLGAGVEGALSRLRTGLFDTELQKVDAPALVGGLRQAGKARDLNALLLYLQDELAKRKLLEERLALLPRNAYTFGRLRSDLQKLGVPRTVLDSRGALGRAYAEVMREMTSALRAAGQALVASGVSAEDALVQLGSTTRPQPWATKGAAQARIVGARLIAVLSP